MLGLTRVKKLRDQVDQIDSMILRLLLERFTLVHEILAIKEGESLELEDPQRDQAIIEKVGSTETTPELQLSLMRVYRAILDWGLRSFPRMKEERDEFLH